MTPGLKYSSHVWISLFLLWARFHCTVETQEGSSLDAVSKSSMHAFHCLAVWTGDNQIDSRLLTFAHFGTLESLKCSCSLEGFRFPSSPWCLDDVRWLWRASRGRSSSAT